MATNFSFNLQETPLEGLEKVRKEIDKEIYRRREMERAKLVENFKSAFMALHSAGIDVRYSDQYEDMDWLLSDWDNFYFDLG